MRRKWLRYRSKLHGTTGGEWVRVERGVLMHKANPKDKPRPYVWHDRESLMRLRDMCNELLDQYSEDDAR